MKEELKVLYMKIALEVSNMSKASRTHVGAVIVKDHNIISFGWNGTPTGYFTNICEKDDITMPYVVHAEQNALAKTSKIGISTYGAKLFVTMSPCFDCAKLIIQSGIDTVYYIDEYTNIESLELLRNCNVKVEQLNF